jgi:hypothetical protein
MLLLMYTRSGFPPMAHPLNSPKDADWYACPSCGAEVQVGSRGCPQCLSGKGSKWDQDEYLDGVDVPEDQEEFDYNDYIKREFGGRGASRLKPPSIAWKWWITGVLLLGAMAWGLKSLCSLKQ